MKPQTTRREYRVHTKNYCFRSFEYVSLHVLTDLVKKYGYANIEVIDGGKTVEFYQLKEHSIYSDEA